MSLESLLREMRLRSQNDRAPLVRHRFLERAVLVGAAFSGQIPVLSREQKRSMASFTLKTSFNELQEVLRVANEDYLLITGIFGNSSSLSDESKKIEEARSMLYALYAFTCFLGGYQGPGLKNERTKSIVDQAALLSVSMEPSIHELNVLFLDHDIPTIPIGRRS